MGTQENILFFLDDRKRLEIDLARQIVAKELDVVIGELNAQVFSDGEVCVDYISSVRGKRVYLVSSPNNSDKLVQLNMAMDAAKRAGAKEIIPIIPYFPYARQDKKDQPRGPIGAKVVARMLEMGGASQVVTFDLHADQIQGFFDIPVTHMEGKFLFDRIVAHLYREEYGDSLVLCSCDAGGLKRVKRLKELIKNNFNIDLPIIVMDKTRSEANKVESMTLIGDTEGKGVLILDDMVDTFGTASKCIDVLYENGATNVNMISTHAILSGKAMERLNNSNLRKLIVTDSLSIKHLSNEPGFDKIEQVSMVDLICSAILSINNGVSFENLMLNR